MSIYPKPEDPIRSKITLCIDEKFLPQNREKLKDITLSLQKLCSAKYGYYYQRHLKNDPTCYVWGGSGSGEINEEDKRQLKKWDDAFDIRWQDGLKLAPLYRTGYLRDIYSLNFLSQEHLDWPLIDSTRGGLSNSQSQTLLQWINLSSEHGTLAELSSDFWCWEISADKIDEVRSKLLPTGIIIGV